MISKNRKLFRLLVTPIVCALIAATVHGCSDMAPVEPGLEENQPPDQEEPQPPPVAIMGLVIAVSNPSAAPNDEVIVAVHLEEQFEQQLAAFVVSLAFDTLTLQVIDTLGLDDGLLRAANFALDSVHIAGASASGLPSDTLFAIRMRVRGTEFVSGLGLNPKELRVLEGLEDITALP